MATDTQDQVSTDPWAEIFASLQPAGSVEGQNTSAGQPGSAGTGTAKSIADLAVGTLAGQLAPGFGVLNLGVQALTDPNFSVSNSINAATFGLAGTPSSDFPGTITDPNVIANMGINPAAYNLGLGPGGTPAGPVSTLSADENAAAKAAATSDPTTTSDATAAGASGIGTAGGISTSGVGGGDLGNAGGIGGVGSDPSAGVGAGFGGADVSSGRGTYAHGGKVKGGSGPGKAVDITAHKDEVVLNRKISQVLDPMDRWLNRLNSLGNHPRRSRDAIRREAKMYLQRMAADL